VKSNAQSSIAKLRLASHVRACRSDDQVILLDLRRDKYLAVGGTQMRVLAAAVEGWPEALAVADMAPSSANVSKLTDRMLLRDRESSHRTAPIVQIFAQRDGSGCIAARTFNAGGGAGGGNSQGAVGKAPG
jgi:hypothetical protein